MTAAAADRDARARVLIVGLQDAIGPGRSLAKMLDAPRSSVAEGELLLLRRATAMLGALERLGEIRTDRERILVTRDGDEVASVALLPAGLEGWVGDRRVLTLADLVDAVGEPRDAVETPGDRARRAARTRDMLIGARTAEAPGGGSAALATTTARLLAHSSEARAHPERLRALLDAASGDALADADARLPVWCALVGAVPEWTALAAAERAALAAAPGDGRSTLALTAAALAAIVRMSIAGCPPREAVLAARDIVVRMEPWPSRTVGYLLGAATYPARDVADAAGPVPATPDGTLAALIEAFAGPGRRSDPVEAVRRMRERCGGAGMPAVALAILLGASGAGAPPETGTDGDAVSGVAERLQTVPRP